MVFYNFSRSQRSFFIPFMITFHKLNKKHFQFFVSYVKTYNRYFLSCRSEPYSTFSFVLIFSNKEKICLFFHPIVFYVLCSDLVFYNASLLQKNVYNLTLFILPSAWSKLTKVYPKLAYYTSTIHATPSKISLIFLKETWLSKL